MSTKDDFDDLPELTDEMLTELKQHPVDLHLGPAQVKPVDDWWIKQYGPKPNGLGIVALDALIMLLTLIVLDLIVMSWIFVFN